MSKWIHKTRRKLKSQLSEIARRVYNNVTHQGGFGDGKYFINLYTELTISKLDYGSTEYNSA